MKKQIFEYQVDTQEETYQPKQTFQNGEVKAEEMFEGELLEAQFEHAVKPKSGLGKTLLKFTALLFGVAIVAQSVQWIWDSIQNQQWIYLAFALVSLIVILFGIKEIFGEWRRLVGLKRREQLRRESLALWQKSTVKNGGDFSTQSAEQIKAICLKMAKSLRLDQHSPQIAQWQNQLNDAYTVQEVAHLFSQNVLKPFDVKVKKCISKMAAESAVVVAISPLSLVDMFFVAWRNLRLINNIAEIYGIELGYWVRIRLLRMVLVNIAFAGASEVVQDIGMDWLSQDITAKLSARAAQGIGVGLLTARLGIKAMEFCRPLAFRASEKPKLSHIQKELLSTIKEVVLNRKIKEKGIIQ